MERKVLVEVTQEELELLNKGITKKDILKNLTIDDLVKELIIRTPKTSLHETDNLFSGNPVNDSFFRVITGTIDLPRGSTFDYKLLERS